MSLVGQSSCPETRRHLQSSNLRTFVRFATAYTYIHIPYFSTSAYFSILPVFLYFPKQIYSSPEYFPAFASSPTFSPYNVEFQLQVTSTSLLFFQDFSLRSYILRSLSMYCTLAYFPKYSGPFYVLFPFFLNIQSLRRTSPLFLHVQVHFYTRTLPYFPTYSGTPFVLFPIFLNIQVPSMYSPLLYFPT
jgi:hypothetical protein